MSRFGVVLQGFCHETGEAGLKGNTVGLHVHDFWYLYVVYVKHYMPTGVCLGLYVFHVGSYLTNLLTVLKYSIVRQRYLLFTNVGGAL